ncbi:MAG: carbohydrate binding family 9 domain-containing protein [Gemmatimonadales bacterium]|nr:carbohydrate binding family 9 domain-containing protein [Gemmatimonadales bacterium]
MLLPLLLALHLGGTDPAVYNGRAGNLDVRLPRLEVEAQIDGALDEPVWAEAAVLTGFSQYSPGDGIAAADSTEVLVWYSPGAIHFGIRAYEAHGAVHATLADRDRIGSDDHVQILLSTFNDGRQATVLAVNPFGVQSDGALVETGATRGNGFNNAVVRRETADLSPDYVYQSKGRLTPYGYEVEVRVPFKSLRYQSAPEQSWGINITRQVQHSGHEDSWVPARRASASFLAQSGRLVGLTELRRGLVLDFNPSITSKTTGSRTGGSWDYRGGRPELGGTVRWGITNNLSLTGTANPDFSQVESDAGQFLFDPREELFFQEKRPFFLDGIEQFTTPNQLVYSRRVVQPVAAAKVTGKVWAPTSPCSPRWTTARCRAAATIIPSITFCGCSATWAPTPGWVWCTPTGSRVATTTGWRARMRDWFSVGYTPRSFSSLAAAPAPPVAPPPHHSGLPGSSATAAPSAYAPRSTPATRSSGR